MVVFKKACRSQENLAKMFKLELSCTVCEQMKVVNEDHNFQMLSGNKRTKQAEAEIPSR